MNKVAMRTAPKTSRDDAIVSQSLDDLFVPGVVVEVTADEADRLGAFEEDAINGADAWAANIDLPGLT